MKRLLLSVGMLATAFLLIACKTPEGPRLALPSQDVSTPVPPGYVRVVFFNDTLEALNWATGTIRIQVDGQTAPSLYLNHYAQLFLRPGEYELMLEHWDVFKFTDRYRVQIAEPGMFFRVWCTPFATKYEVLKTLPPHFESHFTGGRNPSKWPVFEP